MKALVTAIVALAALANCGRPTPKDPVTVARSFLAAHEARDFDAAWWYASSRYRNWWAENLDIARGEVEGGFLFFRPSLFEEEFTREELLALSPRGFHRELLRRTTAPGERPLPPEGSRRELTIEEDRAEVSWPEQDVRIFLTREGGRWRVEAWGFASMGVVERMTGPGGREIAFFFAIDITLKASPFEGMPLPRIPGSREIPVTAEREVLLRLEEGGRATVKSRTYSLEGLEELLFKFAETQRDMMDPMKRSLVRLAIGARAETPLAEVQALLRTVVSPEVRIRHVVLVTNEGGDYPLVGIPADLTCRNAKLKIRYEKPAATAEVGRSVGEAELAGLLAVLPDLRRKGVAAHLPGELRWEDALCTLVVIGSREPGWIILEPASGRIDSGVLLNGEPVEPGAGPLPEPDEAALPLEVKWGYEGR